MISREKCPRRATAPWSSKLGPKEANYYQCQIRVLHWMVEIGWVDIITEVSMLESQMTMPREGHMDAVFHVFS